MQGQVFVYASKRALVPISVQFELTYRCTNACSFCYNRFNGLDSSEAPASSIKRALRNLVSAGVFSVNFNGGEPLIREDFFEIAEYAARLGLDIHLNTNSTLVGKTEARHLARLFPSVCSTVLSAECEIHDDLCGRVGALDETKRGLLELKEQDVYLAANVTLSDRNAAEITSTLQCMRSLGIETALVTRIVSFPGQSHCFPLSDSALFEAIRDALKFQNGNLRFPRIAFPQPYPPCTLPYEIRGTVAKHNIPCTIGLNTARVSPTGDVTPCTMVKRPVLGNIIENPFKKIWQEFDGQAFFLSRLPCVACKSCVDLEYCGGGCLGCNNVLQSTLSGLS